MSSAGLCVRDCFGLPCPSLCSPQTPPALWGDTEGHDKVEHKALKTHSYSLRSRTLTINRQYDIEYLRLTDVLPVQFAAYQSFM